MDSTTATSSTLLPLTVLDNPQPEVSLEDVSFDVGEDSSGDVHDFDTNSNSAMIDDGLFLAGLVSPPFLVEGVVLLVMSSVGSLLNLMAFYVMMGGKVRRTVISTCLIGIDI